MNHIIILKYQVSYLPNITLSSLGVEKDKLSKSFGNKEEQETLILWQADGSVQRFLIILINICYYLLNVVVPAKVVSQYLKCLIYCVVITHWARFKQSNLHIFRCQNMSRLETDAVRSLPKM